MRVDRSTTTNYYSNGAATASNGNVDRAQASSGPNVHEFSKAASSRWQQRWSMNVEVGDNNRDILDSSYANCGGGGDSHGAAADDENVGGDGKEVFDGFKVHWYV